MRIRQNIHENPVKLGQRELHVTVSIGVATMMPSEGMRHVDLIGAADRALYAAKAAGRNITAAAETLAEARRLASAVPIDGKRASDKDTNAAFKGKADVKSRLETEWDSFAKASYARARELAESAPGRIK